MRKYVVRVVDDEDEKLEEYGTEYKSEEYKKAVREKVSDILNYMKGFSTISNVVTRPISYYGETRVSIDFTAYKSNFTLKMVITGWGLVRYYLDGELIEKYFPSTRNGFFTRNAGRFTFDEPELAVQCAVEMAKDYANKGTLY